MHIRKEISSIELNPKKFTSKRPLLWYTGRNLSLPEYYIQTRNLLAYLERYDTDVNEKYAHFGISECNWTSTVCRYLYANKLVLDGQVYKFTTTRRRTNAMSMQQRLYWDNDARVLLMLHIRTKN